MKKLWLVLLVLSLVSCGTANEVYVNDQPIEVGQAETKEKHEEPIETKSDDSGEVLVDHKFITGDEAVKILSANDDYTSKLSIYDYHSKFFSDKPLDTEGLKAVYSEHVLEWNDDQKASVDEAMKNINAQMVKFDIDMPDISFILTSNKDEGGAAYTRGQSIILKPQSVYKYSINLEHLIVHELFHVYSRAHKDLRPAMYEIIGYKPCKELKFPKEIEDLRISNPDAPDNNFYITGTYQGEMYSFIPIIYSSEPYEIGSGASFFQTLQDKMLAVEIKDDAPIPIYVDDEPLIVNKNHIDEFYEKVGLNTDYTYHPEETMADNFVYMLYEMDVKSPWVLEGLKAVIDKNKK